MITKQILYFIKTGGEKGLGFSFNHITGSNSILYQYYCF